MDRRVHASHPAGEEVVRYDRAGAWYIELVDPSPHAPMRDRVTIKKAVRRALELAEDGLGQIHFGLPGGQTFEARVREESKRAKGPDA